MKKFQPNPHIYSGNPPQAIKGGIPLQKVPVIPWEAFVACGLKVYKDDKVQVAVFAPEPMETADEVFQTIRLLIAAMGRKPGPIAWQTVPPQVQRHFQFKDEDNDIVAS